MSYQIPDLCFGFGFNELDNLISNFDACRRDRSSLLSLCVCVCVRILERLTSISAENMRVVSLRLAKPCLIENLVIVIIFTTGVLFLFHFFSFWHACAT